LGHFNLLEEPWILVMTDEKGSSEEVSLIQLFRNAYNYKQLAGETPMQNFAIMRLILAVLHTVFSRFNAEGRPYPYLVLDKSFRQLKELDEDDLEEHIGNLMDTWRQLWSQKTFPQIVMDYLYCWKDRFYLFDLTHPFYQVTKEELLQRPIKAGRGNNPTRVRPRTFNRTISESENKIALFSPRYEANANKDRLSEAELARWLVLYQGVVGTGDKAVYQEFKGTSSKGWIYDLGGIALHGRNLYETLLLNLALVHPEKDYKRTIQRPCWERTGNEIVSDLLLGYPVNNLAELYTNWSRAVYIDAPDELNNNFSISTVKLPEIDHRDQFLELMTLWRFRIQGPNKNSRTPQKHHINESLWRSFGTVFLTKEPNDKRSGIIDWFYTIAKITGQTYAVIESYGMESDGNATSWLPVDEYYDILNINKYVLTDVKEDGWVIRIDGEVEKAKEVIDKVLRKFVYEVQNIRNMKGDGLVNKIIKQAYYEIDQPFRNWLSSLEANQDKDERIREWRQNLRDIVRKTADCLLQSAWYRDYKGIFERDKPFRNIATAYNQFDYWLNRTLGLVKS
jgi:CRISPR system Cascade subunit CasA